MFKKVLIANRGSIACRILRTLKSMQIQSVVIFSESDRNSLHVQQADEAFCLEADIASDTYLCIDKIIAIAKKTGAEAVHPGYGFLSENTDFSKRCEAEGIVFIGPTTQQIEQFGLKHSARKLAQSNNVPLIPGTDLLQTVSEALKAANDIGYPVMLKSTAGGGGIGMQVCHSDEQIKEAFVSVKRLSQNNFGNDGIFLEKFISRSRHIEVQIVGDGRGHVATLGERDCSLQRRNQKLIEETPAPNLAENIRDNMVKAAYRLAKAVNYRSAGTVEFIYDVEANDFYFLEMNTRLQVEHGVTEMVTGVDLVQWMIEIAARDFDALLSYQHEPKGHAIQARLYAEDAGKNFQPSSGLLTSVSFPENCRCDTYIETGLTVPAFYDPMLAKIIAHADTRDSALTRLLDGLSDTFVEGIMTNKHYLQKIIQTPEMHDACFTTDLLNQFSYHSTGIDVLDAGTQTTIQDYPGRMGLWSVGVPPSGPMDHLALQIGNCLLGNQSTAAGLEMTLSGASLQFRCDTVIALTGALMEAVLTLPQADDAESVQVDFWKPISIKAGSILRIGKLVNAGMRSYLCVKEGLQVADYLGSKSTFTLGQFGGHGGRALQVGDVLSIKSISDKATADKIPDDENKVTELSIDREAFSQITPSYKNTWSIAVIYGPHGAPDFFTQQDIDTFFATDWEVHFNSSRTGVRLIGPKPQWARSDGGEAGLHPSNIHDNAYAIGAIDFTGDMPVILGPDGPSLGGFVCPFTIIKAELWKMGQLSPGDTIRFIPVDTATAEQYERRQIHSLEQLTKPTAPLDQPSAPVSPETTVIDSSTLSPILHRSEENENHPEIIYRISGDDNILIEYGPQELDLRLRFRVHALMRHLQEQIDSGQLTGIINLTPGIRSLQVHFENLSISRQELLTVLQKAQSALGDINNISVPTRTVYLPLSWDDPSTKMAIEKYMTTVNPDAPWCPSNIEFIRRINGLDSIDDVKKIVFDASYLVMGLGDVYLGAPVATPLDPRHRLVTTKYNPARTWTPENAVGIGGAYMCVYGMEGPGGYQFVGRTIQMWNRYHQTKDFSKPWLLRFFDQIRFFEVSAEELSIMRRDFPTGAYSIRTEESEFSLAEYEHFLQENTASIEQFRTQQRQAFSQERERWQEQGLSFESIDVDEIVEPDEIQLDENETPVFSSVPGSLWKLNVVTEQAVKKGDILAIIESMKMEISVVAENDGVVKQVIVKEGQQLTAGQIVLTVISS